MALRHILVEGQGLAVSASVCAAAVLSQTQHGQMFVYIRLDMQGQAGSWDIKRRWHCPRWYGPYQLSTS